MNEKLMVMGRILGPFGVKGWLKLQPLTAAPGNLLEYGSWWIESKAGWQLHTVERAHVHGSMVTAKLVGCSERDIAATYSGCEVAVPRAEFPAAGENEYYWTDLIGTTVTNLEGENLGTVSRVFETGANDVLVVDGTRERLIPFTEQVVLEVDLTARLIRVDWGLDY